MADNDPKPADETPPVTTPKKKVKKKKKVKAKPVIPTTLTASIGGEFPL